MIFPVKVDNMLSGSFIDTNSPSYGTIRVLAPLPEVLSNNLSHIREAYQNLPQIGRPIILPLNYKSYDQYYNHNHKESGYNNELHIIPPHSNKFQVHRNNFQKRDDDDGDTNLSKRDGYGHGHGWGWGDTGHHGKKSPALSALALLGFMFFLNLIQTSLQNNRQMLAAAALNATTVGYVAGRMRTKRDVPLEGDGNIGITTSQFVQNPHPPALSLATRRKNKDTHSSKKGRRNIHFTTPKITSTTQNTQSVINENAIETFKSASLQCFQLLSCKLAKHLYSEVDPATGMILYILRESILSRIPTTKSWTGRMVRAFSHGWERGKICENIYHDCALLNDIFKF